MGGIKISTADKLFSQYVRSRAGWRCERCNGYYEPPTMALHCSHYHGRGKRSVRFDPENAAALCYGCHMHFTAHPLEHTDWFKKRLGDNKFDLLMLRANTPQRVDEKLIRIGLRQLIRELP